MAAIPTLLVRPADPSSIGLTWFGLMLSVVGGILQERDSKPYVFNFRPDDWRVGGEGYCIDIPIGTHRKYKAGMAEIYTLTSDGRYHVCVCSVGRDDSGNCRVEISADPFTGRIVIQ